MSTNVSNSLPRAFPLSAFWRPERLEDYKVHFARWNGYDQPLHVFVGSFDDWRAWQEWYPSKNDFNRPHIFSVAQFPEAPDRWLFGGVWDVHGIGTRASGEAFYNVELSDTLRPLIGRLVLHRVHKGRGTRLNMENHFNHFTLYEVLPEPYSGQPFPGYDSIDLSFSELEALIKNGRQDWMTALSHAKGIYLITDTNTMKRYVGSAYGEWGIWQRWQEYVRLGHGGNAGMRDLLKDHALDYCRNHFRLALLEQHHYRVDDQTVIERESHWKRVLETRHDETGLNRN